MQATRVRPDDRVPLRPAPSLSVQGARGLRHRTGSRRDSVGGAKDRAADALLRRRTADERDHAPVREAVRRLHLPASEVSTRKV